MNFSRIALAAIVAWVVSIPVGYVVNEIILKDLFQANAAAFRPDDVLMSMLPIGFAFMLVGFFVFAYAYAKGYEGGSGVMEGIRFGVIIGLLIDCFAISWWYVTVPMDSTLAMAMMVDNIVEPAMYGAIVGALYKPAK